VEGLEKALSSAQVALVIIGRQWLTAADDSGRLCLQDEKDFVRREVGRALARKMPVIPVLVQQGALPREDQMPEELRPLARRQAIELHHITWSDDVARLTEAIEFLSSPSGADGDPAGSVRSGEARQRRSPSGQVETARSREKIRRFNGCPPRRGDTMPADRDLPWRPGSPGSTPRRPRNAISKSWRIRFAMSTRRKTFGQRSNRCAMRWNLTIDFKKDDLKEADFVQVDPSRVDLKGVSLEDAFLLSTDFSGSDLSGANLLGAFIRNTNFPA
jgi:hypothetical protein